MTELEREIETTTPPHFTEGPFVHYYNGLYYLSYSSGWWQGASYSVHYATSSSPLGPWQYRGRILESDDRHKGPGHHSIFRNPATDEWFIVYHRWNDREGSGPFTGTRRTAIERLVHDTNGNILSVIMTDTGPGPIKLGPAE